MDHSTLSTLQESRNNSFEFPGRSSVLLYNVPMSIPQQAGMLQGAVSHIRVRLWTSVDFQL